MIYMDNFAPPSQRQLQIYHAILSREALRAPHLTKFLPNPHQSTASKLHTQDRQNEHYIQAHKAHLLQS